MAGPMAGLVPALGPYAGTVLAAYGVTLVPIAALILASWRRSVRVKQALACAEAARTPAASARAAPARTNPTETLHAP